MNLQEQPAKPAMAAAGAVARFRLASLRVGLLLALLVAWLAPVGGTACATLIAPPVAWVVKGEDGRPPGNADWAPVDLPDDAAQSRPATGHEPYWYRIGFDVPAAPESLPPWAVYMPYFYYGGEVWLNGALLARVRVSDDEVYARSFRPRLIALPAASLKSSHNELFIWAAAQPDTVPILFARPLFGPVDELQPIFDSRLFWARTVPQLTLFSSMLVAGFMLLIWWFRPNEKLYGLFALASLLWGIRSFTFLIDAMPWLEWNWWRVLYQTATGTFVIVMALFALRLARIERPWVARALIGYGLVGPLWFAFGGFAADAAIGRWWLGGMMLVGVAIIGITVSSLRRQKRVLPAVLRFTMVFAVLAGIHDWLLTWEPGVLALVLPEWTGRRIFLLHVGTSAMLLAMGGILTARFIRSLTALEELNRTLETRVADRERALAANFEQLAALQREKAAAEERQLIMRELHDGLGSQLFTSLSRVERGDMDERQIAAALRDCIADMRLALDALASRDNDIGATFGDFMFRWRAQLAAAGVESTWSVDLPNHATALAPHAALQVLRIAQEALTNVLKHARATHVSVRLMETGAALELWIEDDGRGVPAAGSPQGRGLGNMRARAQRLGGAIDWQPAVGGGTRVVLVLPLAHASGASEPEPEPASAPQRKPQPAQPVAG